VLNINIYILGFRFVSRRTAVFHMMKRREAEGDREEVAEEVM
jgi:hypothetical protein